ncbi:hypothetical protein [Paenibacillus sp. IITD108]|uniref:hypothetical protein n=1 Tax=Paenibacillus sp. IITD108 TaxID=3116649 RepID=UPI002F41DAE1
MITIYKHKGIEIQVKAVAEQHEIGYSINHPVFEGKRFNLVQEAIDAIDNM